MKWISVKNQLPEEDQEDFDGPGKSNEKCPRVEMQTGLRDCWRFGCKRDHRWRYYEIYGQPKEKPE